MESKSLVLEENLENKNIHEFLKVVKADLFGKVRSMLEYLLLLRFDEVALGLFLRLSILLFEG
jgi:hypothetical protein